KMKAQIKGLDMASKNSEDAISLIQTAEGSLTEVNNMLTRVRELTVQAGNDTNQQQDRVKIAEEVATLLTEIDSISTRTEFNEKKLNDGSFQDGHFQIGANSGQKLELSINNMSVMGIGVDKIMDTFGIEKTIDTTIKTTGGITTGKPTNASFTSGAISSTGTAGSADSTITVKYKDAAGDEKTIDVKVDLSGATDAAGSATAIKDALNNSDKFKEVFGEATGDENGIKFDAKEAGIMSEISLTVNDNQVSAANGNATAGTGGSINLDNAKAGDTITIAGKTYTMTEANKEGDVANGFSDMAGLTELLKNDGIDLDANGGITAVNHQTSKLSGTYSINEGGVSNKGKEYSELLDDIDESLKHVTTQRAKLGANQNRLEYTINSLNLSSENLTAAKSRIEDTDMAKEMMNLTSAN
ncbi:MAG: hypothetical protein K2F59_04605, partial [Eubacteriales bacterium]|nr:hypothetical protein [Eubacteriales bacterium]